MHFNLENDTGTRVVGYVVPDAFSTVPSIRVISGGDEVLFMAANEDRKALVTAGRHETGRCGFSIDTRLLPQLGEMKDLEIFDADTGILIYRRPLPHVVRKKILRLESHLFPLSQFDEALRPSFQYFCKGIENLGSETVTQLFLLNKVASVYLSGRILYKNYAYYIESGFDTFLLVQDPYSELAERLLVLANIRKVGAACFDLRDSLGMRGALAYAEALLGTNAELDEKTLIRNIKRIPSDVAATLSNPLVRELTAATPDEMPGRNAMASALDMLASMSVLGLRTESDIFVSAVAEFLGIDGERLTPIPQFNKVPLLASILKKSGVVEAFLDKDLELFEHVVEARQKVALAVGG